MSPKQIKRLQIFIILFLSSLTLYVLFREAKKNSANLDQKKKEAEALKQAKPEQQKEKKAESSQDPQGEPQTQAPQKPLTQQQKEVLNTFKLRGEEIKAQLPQKADLQTLDDNQVHSIPRELLQTGRELGKLKEMVLMYPDFKELQTEAKSYYKSCADNENYPTSIRSLCLFNRLQLAKNNNEEFDLTPYPLEIKQLVLELAPFKSP